MEEEIVVAEDSNEIVPEKLSKSSFLRQSRFHRVGIGFGRAPPPLSRLPPILSTLKETETHRERTALSLPRRDGSERRTARELTAPAVAAQAAAAAHAWRPARAAAARACKLTHIPLIPPCSCRTCELVVHPARPPSMRDWFIIRKRWGLIHRRAARRWRGQPHAKRWRRC